MVKTTHTATAGEAVSCLLTGFRVALRVPTVRRQVLKSIIVNGIVFAAIFAGLVWGTLTWTAGFVDSSFWLLAGFGWLLRVAFIVGALLFFPPIFTVILGIILPMFMTPVFMAGRDWAGGPDTEGPDSIRDELRTLVIDLRRLLRLVLFSALILPFNLIPIVGNAAYAITQALIAANTLGWDLLGRHFELHGMEYNIQLAYLRKHRSMTLALGFVAGLLCLIPLANIVFVTTNVCGAGVLSAQLDGADKQLEG